MNVNQERCKTIPAKWSPRISPSPIRFLCQLAALRLRCSCLCFRFPIDEEDGDGGDGDEGGGEGDGEDEVEVRPAREDEGAEVGRRAGALAVGARARLEAGAGRPVARRQRLVEELNSGEILACESTLQQQSHLDPT